MKKYTKKLMICGLIVIGITLSGCGNSISYSIPKNAVAISDSNENIYVNPNDVNDSYGCVEINGVQYIIYGVQGRTLTSDEIGDCIAYSRADHDERFYKVNGSSDFIASYYVNGEMEQFNFWRNVDTIGMNIDVPDYIDSLGDKIWDVTI